jgi:hypothetical protein
MVWLDGGCCGGDNDSDEMNSTTSLWYIFHTCENHKDKDTLVEKLDAFIDIRTNCTIREVGTYMKGVFNIEDEDNWMLHSLPE